VNANDAAYPCIFIKEGLSKKEAVAIAALQGLLAMSRDVTPRVEADMVATAWKLAGLACERWKEGK
jgi:hypothetical protein